jgi:predicted DNA-binding transcriptional regulator AlpA
MIDDLDPFVRAVPICQMLGGVCRRTLYDRVQKKQFPPPDRKAQKRGEADLWRLSTVRRALQDYGRAESAA